MAKDEESSVIACTLAGAEYMDRAEWIEELNAAALRGYWRDGSRITLAYNVSAAARVRELVRRERQCCPFLGFTIWEGSDVVVVVIEAPKEAATAADALFAPYTATTHCGGPQTGRPRRRLAT